MKTLKLINVNRNLEHNLEVLTFQVLDKDNKPVEPRQQVVLTLPADFLDLRDLKTTVPLKLELKPAS